MELSKFIYEYVKNQKYYNEKMERNYMRKHNYKKGIIIIGILILLLPFVNITKAQEKTIIVTSPKEGKTIYLGSEFTITWIPPEYVPYVKILLFQEQTQITHLDMYLENLGEFLWSVSEEDFRIGDNYRLKIIAFNLESYYGYSGFFSIKEKPEISEKVAITTNITIIIIIVIVLLVIYDFKTKKRILRLIRRIRK